MGSDKSNSQIIPHLVTTTACHKKYPQMTDYFVVVLCTQAIIQIFDVNRFTDLCQWKHGPSPFLRFPPTLKPLQKSWGAPTLAFLFSQGTRCTVHCTLYNVYNVQRTWCTWKVFLFVKHWLALYNLYCLSKVAGECHKQTNVWSRHHWGFKEI